MAKEPAALPVARRAIRPAHGPLPPSTSGTMPRFLEESGGAAALACQTVYRGLRPPYTLGPEFLTQFRYTLAICWFPLVLTSFALSFGPAGIQASGFLGLFGALDRLGGVYVIVTIREFAPLVTGIVVAGVAGTAMCADLGARVVREEMDALRVLGIDPIKSLVAPRLFVIVIACVVFDVFSIIAGLSGAMLVVLQNHEELGPFFSTFFANGNTLEYGASLLKAAIFGAIIASVCCYKGLNVGGGPEGVGRAVNQSVVISFLAIGAIDFVFTQFLLATHPLLSEVRG